MYIIRNGISPWRAPPQQSQKRAHLAVQKRWSHGGLHPHQPNCCASASESAPEDALPTLLERALLLLFTLAHLGATTVFESSSILASDMVSLSGSLLLHNNPRYNCHCDPHRTKAGNWLSSDIQNAPYRSSDRLCC